MHAPSAPARAVLRAWAATLCVLVGISAAWGQAGTKDSPAADKVLAARRRLDRLTSYRVNVALAPGTVVLLTQGATVLVEVVNPDRFRSVFKMGTLGTAESITVGRHARSRTTGARSAGRWECKADDRPVHALLPAIPAKRTEIVSLTVLGEASSGGARMRGYQYQKKEGARLSTYRLYTLAERGLPRRVEAFSAQGRQDVTADYFDYDAPIKIELPPCG